MNIQDGIKRSTRQALDDAGLKEDRAYLSTWIFLLGRCSIPDYAHKENWLQALAQCRFALKELGDIVV